MRDPSESFLEKKRKEEKKKVTARSPLCTVEKVLMKVGETKLLLTSLYLEVRCKQVRNEISEAILWVKRCSTEPGFSPRQPGNLSPCRASAPDWRRP